ncbi:MAG TPA: hypothetical protein VGF55_06125, partial [Gemmataceae bacterium]
MSAPRSRPARLLAVAIAAAAGGVLAHTLSRPFVPDRPAALVLPYPHHIPKTPGGVSLRFAMVQDVLHERFDRHGPAYYAERNRRARAELASLQPGDRWDSLSDDLGAGLDRLGDDDEAVRVLRAKLASQTARGVTGRGLYTTYANLGTFLIHGSFRAAQAGDAAAKERLYEGHGYIRKAIEVKPDAHFGREQWQAAAVEFLVVAIVDRKLLRKFDLIGNRLDAEIDPSERRAFFRVMPADSGVPDIRDAWVNWGEARRTAYGLRAGNIAPEDASSYRRYITQVGAEEGWPANLIISHPKPIPFDEPVLGLIGMWRQGGGASPHFALCLGETMLRVGQRYLAWSAFERASRLADRYWPDTDLQQFLRDHCRKRQQMIEQRLPPDEVAELRPRFDAELEYGRRYQREYQQYEADQIVQGRSIEDEHFYDAFHAGRKPIASPVGPEDELRVISET